MRARLNPVTSVSALFVIALTIVLSQTLVFPSTAAEIVVLAELTGTPTSTATPTAIATLTARVYLPLVRREPTPASIKAEDFLQTELLLQPANIRVGQTFEATAKLHNQRGGTVLGAPWFTLYIEQDQENPVFEPVRPEGTSGNYSSIPPGSVATVSWTLQAVRPGTARLYFGVAGEIWDPECNCWYLIGTGSERVLATAFEPRKCYLPLIVE